LAGEHPTILRTSGTYLKGIEQTEFALRRVVKISLELIVIKWLMVCGWFQSTSHWGKDCSPFIILPSYPLVDEVISLAVDG
jgi:hypothetical protein